MIEELVKFQNELMSRQTKITPGMPGVLSEAASTTDNGRQGDVYIRYVDDIPHDYIEVEPFLKVVPGTTRGSQHCWENMPTKCFVPPNWNSTNYDELRGPICYNEKENVLGHGQHGSITTSPNRYVEIAYQKSLVGEEKRISRARD